MVVVSAPLGPGDTRGGKISFSGKEKVCKMNCQNHAALRAKLR